VEYTANGHVYGHGCGNRVGPCLKTGTPWSAATRRRVSRHFLWRRFLRRRTALWAENQSCVKPQHSKMALYLTGIPLENESPLGLQRVSRYRTALWAENQSGLQRPHSKCPSTSPDNLLKTEALWECNGSHGTERPFGPKTKAVPGHSTPHGFVV